MLATGIILGDTFMGFRPELMLDPHIVWWFGVVPLLAWRPVMVFRSAPKSR